MVDFVHFLLESVEFYIIFIVYVSLIVLHPPCILRWNFYHFGKICQNLPYIFGQNLYHQLNPSSFDIFGKKSILSIFYLYFWTN